jgi:protein required for attachment to host cells
MQKQKIVPGEWVVVCDGSKVLILLNVGDARFPNLKTKEVREEKHALTREIGSDEPGKVQQSVGTARSGYEQTDWHEQEEQRFLKKLVMDLERAVIAGETKGALMVAPPRALGVLREAYPPHLRAALRGEISKDLVKLPVHEIEAHLAG